MSNWDLMMPGMGLTAIGVAGVTVSYAGIAHTFVDGMHALTGLTMFIGLIFLAAGILDGGISTSNRAKATTLVVLSIAMAFGMFAFTMNSISTLPIFAGVLIAIAFPSIVMAYVAMKMPKYAKPVGAIFGLAAAAGIVTFVAFGFVSPDTYMINEEVQVIEEAPIAGPTAPIFTITMLAGSSVEGAPDYDPDVAHVTQGHIVEWVNADSVAHTATSSSDFGETFNTNLLAAGAKFQLDTQSLAIGEYEYMCIVHPWMTATLIIEEPKEPATVSIPSGAGIQQIGQIYYDPEVIQIPAGTKVVWTNNDNAVHTVTSGSAQGGPNGKFDSGLIQAGATFEYTFSTPGKEDYFCIVHPWMIGSVDVE